MKRVINNKTKNQNDLSACSEQLGRYKLAHYLHCSPLRITQTALVFEIFVFVFEIEPSVPYFILQSLF